MAPYTDPLLVVVRVKPLDSCFWSFVKTPSKISGRTSGRGVTPCIPEKHWPEAEASLVDEVPRGHQMGKQTSGGKTRAMVRVRQVFF
jgi:hypothetical protein